MLVEGVETCIDGQPWRNPPPGIEASVRSRLPFRVKSVSRLQGVWTGMSADYTVPVVQNARYGREVPDQTGGECAACRTNTSNRPRRESVKS